MGSEDLFWKRKRSKIVRKRHNRGLPKPLILIVCEGECTEPNYFKSFRVSSAVIKIAGLGSNTLSLVRQALALKTENSYDQVWVVFDRDEHRLQNFNEAFELAQKNDIRIAYSNQAFELWYLLHFHYFNTAISRQDYILKLNDLLRSKYQKNDRNMYDVLREKQKTAIQNAKKLLHTHGIECKPAAADPSTTVFLLVEMLNQYL